MLLLTQDVPIGSLGPLVMIHHGLLLPHERSFRLRTGAVFRQVGHECR